MKDLNKFRGCLIGGAAGDALGYAVEFCSEAEILRRYAEKGICAYDLTDGRALISDDTQMTLFTANGLLEGSADGWREAMTRSYQDWLLTQEERYDAAKIDGKRLPLLAVPELYSRRAPGSTCLSAIRGFDKKVGTVDAPINASKGCGGVMRAAPVGLYFDAGKCSADAADRIGAEVAAMTHGHELGYIPAAALTHIIRQTVHEGASLADAVEGSVEAMQHLFAGAAHLKEFVRLMQRAIDLAAGDTPDIEVIHQLGEGWVAEETLAIAVYCALKYENDFDRALIASVNHRGDSDSTGAVTGNILGACLGLDAVPEKYTENLELYDVIVGMADRLYDIV